MPKAAFFNTLPDETTDVCGVQQLSLCVRYVIKKSIFVNVFFNLFQCLTLLAKDLLILFRPT